VLPSLTYGSTAARMCHMRHFASIAGLVLACFLRPAIAAEYSFASDQAVVGAIQSVKIKASDTLLDIARAYDIGYVQLVAANPGIDPWLPGAGKTVIIPSEYILPDAPRTGIVVNLGERRIFYFPPDGGQVETFPAGVGVEAKATPLGTTRVVLKETAPVWIPPPSIRTERPELPAMIGPGPDNPLGAFALRLGWTNYLIHGTNKPDSVGRNVSHGCLHLYPEDIARLFKEVPVGMPVRVIDQPAEIAWVGDRLMIEAHADKDQADAIDIGQAFAPMMPKALLTQVALLAAQRAAPVDWEAVRKAGLERRGIPVAVATAAPSVELSATGADLR
jgi:L,D-transpeptidase ErfK/SrfK